MTFGTAAQGRLGRRRLLLGLGATMTLPFVSGCGERLEPLPSPWRPGSRLDSMVPSTDPYLDITNGNTGEHVAARFAVNGNYDERAIRRLDWIFRDWRQNKSPEIDPRLYWALAAISGAARADGHSGEITLLSGYRTKRTNNMLRQRGGGAASNSYHTRRRAADIRLEGIEAGQIADYAEWLQIGGVGRYPNDRFTHVDSGPTRTWNG